MLAKNPRGDDAIGTHSRVTRSTDQIWTRVDDELVMLNVESGIYFAINDIGAAVWERLQEPRLVSELCADLTEEFDVTLEACVADVRKFLGVLKDRGLVVVER